MSKSLNSTSADEIRSLERRFASDPAGLVFARLADAYRKAGLLTRALEVVERGLRRHPDYLNARLVKARALRDLGNRADAATAFEAVLEIDSSNQIALRALGDLAGEAGDFEAARRWYARLLEAEPFVEEPVRRLLDRLPVSGKSTVSMPAGGEREKKRSVGRSGTATVASASIVSETVAVGTGLARPAPVVAGEAAPEPAEEPVEEPAEVARDYVPEQAEGIAEEAPHPPLEAAPEGEPVESADAISAEPSPHARFTEDREAKVPATADLDEVLEEVAQASTAEAAAGGAPGEEAGGEPPAEAAEGEPLDDVSGKVEPQKEALDSHARESSSELMTPTLADLYLQQGLVDEAIRIYERLVRRRPDDLRLAERLEAARARAARRPSTPRAVSGGPERRESADSARSAPREEAPRGPSIRRYLDDLIEGRPGGDVAAGERGVRFVRWLRAIRGA